MRQSLLVAAFCTVNLSSSEAWQLERQPGHVHALIRPGGVPLHPSVDVAKLVKEAKGSSSHLVNHELRPNEPFKWQGAYGAFTLGKKDVPALIRYIEQQPIHHRDGTLWDEAERCVLE